MTIRPTDPDNLGEVILTRDCHIEYEGEVGPLRLSFVRPERTGDRGVRGALRFECTHFDETLTVAGGDDVQVLTILLGVGRTYLQTIAQGGFIVWWREKGDLHYFDFWMGRQFEQEFCLPSARTEAKREAFYKANAGKTLMPQHSVAIEPDRPAVTIYRIHKDGSETLGNVIGPDEIRSHTMYGLAERIGISIFYGTRGLDRLFDQLKKPDREPDPGPHPTNARSST